MISRVVFDLDGTLITCENKQKFVLYSVMKSIGGIEIEKLDKWWDIKRNGNSTEHALNKLNISNANFIAERWEKLIENFTYCLLDKPFIDSLSTLKYLKAEHELYIVILTSRYNKFQVFQTIYRFGFNKYIDDLIVVKPNETVNKKETFLKRINPLMYIGDSELDHLAALNSNTRFIALSRGQRSTFFLKNNAVSQIENDLTFLNNKTFITKLKKRR